MGGSVVHISRFIRKMHRGLYAIYSNSSEYSQEGRI